MEQASVGGMGPGAAEQTTSGASPESDPSKAALPAFQHGSLAYHPHTLPAAYPFGYWTGQVRAGVLSGIRPKPWQRSASRSSLTLQSQGAPLVYGGPFYGGILPGMFQSPPTEAPKLGTREQAVVLEDAPEVWHTFAISSCSQRPVTTVEPTHSMVPWQTSDRKPDPRSLSEGRSSARTESSQSLEESPAAAQSMPTTYTPDQGTSQRPQAPTGFVRVQPSNGNSQDRQVLPGLWRPKAMAPASAADLQSLASGDSPQVTAALCCQAAPSSVHTVSRGPDDGRHEPAAKRWKPDRSTESVGILTPRQTVHAPSNTSSSKLLFKAAVLLPQRPPA